MKKLKACAPRGRGRWSQQHRTASETISPRTLLDAVTTSSGRALRAVHAKPGGRTRSRARRRVCGRAARSCAGGRCLASMRAWTSVASSSTSCRQCAIAAERAVSRSRSRPAAIHGATGHCPPDRSDPRIRATHGCTIARPHPARRQHGRTPARRSPAAHAASGGSCCHSVKRCTPSLRPMSSSPAIARPDGHRLQRVVGLHATDCSRTHGTPCRSGREDRARHAVRGQVRRRRPPEQAMALGGRVVLRQTAAGAILPKSAVQEVTKPIQADVQPISGAIASKYQSEGAGTANALSITQVPVYAAARNVRATNPSRPNTRSASA